MTEDASKNAQVTRYHPEHGPRTFAAADEPIVGWFETPAEAGYHNVGTDKPKWEKLPEEAKPAKGDKA